MKESTMKSNTACVLAINGGSSSIKFVLYQTSELLERRLSGKIDRIGLPGTNLTFSDPTGHQQDSRSFAAADHKSAAKFLIDWLQEQNSFAAVRAVDTAWSTACNTPRPSWSPRNCWTNCIASGRTTRNICPARSS